MATKEQIEFVVAQEGIGFFFSDWCEMLNLIFMNRRIYISVYAVIQIRVDVCRIICIFIREATESGTGLECLVVEGLIVREWVRESCMHAEDGTGECLRTAERKFNKL